MNFELNGKVGTHVLFAGGSLAHFFTQLDENIDLFRADALDRFLVVIREVVFVEDICFCEALDVRFLI